MINYCEDLGVKKGKREYGKPCYSRLGYVLVSDDGSNHSCHAGERADIKTI